ncbi:alpha-xenorhabdolysin family binary toxin subunit B [Pseudomonas sp.]|uniref:alpha-xenorhabdolysin family binary toxin subunit B n=1 Tax=Pseudomonas sp. TaxID=306 RepID=UPI003FD6F56B
MTTTNNVVTLGAHANFAAPDMQQLTGAVRAIRDLSANTDVQFLKVSYLPNLHDKFKRLTGDVYDSNSQVRESSQKLMHQLMAALKTVRLNETAPAPLTDERTAESIEMISDTLDVVKLEGGKLEARLSAVSWPLDRQSTDSFIAGLTDDITRITQDIDQATTTVDRLNEQRKVLTAGIDALETKDITAFGKDSILTAEKVLALGVTPPEVELIKLALEQMKKLVEEIGKGITFFPLVKERDALVSKINRTRDTDALKNNEKRLMEQRIEFINTLYSIDDQRVLYVNEARKINLSTQRFIDTQSAHSASTEERVAVFIEGAVAFSDYLNVIDKSPTQ